MTFPETMNTIFYAGDTKVLSCGEKLEQLLDTEGNELQKPKSWFDKKKKLTLNSSKTKCMIFRNWTINSNKELKVNNIAVYKSMQNLISKSNNRQEIVGGHVYIFERETQTQLSSLNKELCLLITVSRNKGRTSLSTNVNKWT